MTSKRLIKKQITKLLLYTVYVIFLRQAFIFYSYNVPCKNFYY
jgi:hypothetical protein